MPGLHTPGQRSEGDAWSFVAVKTNCLAGKFSGAPHPRDGVDGQDEVRCGRQ